MAGDFEEEANDLVLPEHACRFEAELFYDVM